MCRDQRGCGDRSRAAITGPCPLLILMEAARQRRLGNGGLAVPAAFRGSLGITRKQKLAALADLVAFGEAVGWTNVTQSNHRATRVQPTTSGMRRL